MKKNYFKNLAQVAVLLCAPLFIASCDEFGTEDNPAGAYPSMSTAAVKLNLGAVAVPGENGATYTRTADVASPAYVDYSSSDEKVATVDGFGVVTAVGGGDCEIIAKPYFFKDGGKLYTKEEIKYPVTVKDWRARIALKEGAKIPIYNSAMAGTVEAIDMNPLLDVWPLKGEGITIKYELQPNTKGAADKDPKDILDDAELLLGKIKLTGKAGVAKVTAKITGTTSYYETASFPKAQETDTLTIEVKEGVAYISGYDAKGKPVTSYMFKNYDGQKYTDLSTVVKGTNDVYLEAGWYYLDQSINFTKSIRVKGDVNIILADGKYLDLQNSSNSILDETAKQTHTLNIYPEPGMTGQTQKLPAIQDFKALNIYGGNFYDATNIKAIETVNIHNGVLECNFVDAGTVNMDKGTIGKYKDYNVKANALNIKGGTVNVVSVTGNITMSDGTLVVKQTANDKYAVVGNVTVTKGDLTAQSPYHAVDGKLTGTFYSSTTGAAKSWKKVSGDSTTDPYLKTVNPDE